LFKRQHFKIFIPAVMAVMMAACSSSPSATTSQSAASAPQDKSVTLLFNVHSPSIDPNTDVNYIAVRAGVGETLIKVTSSWRPGSRKRGTVRTDSTGPLTSVRV
jgi:peptide/nickel transport system substrate-binding protein